MKPTKQIKTELATAYRCVLEVGILNMKAPLRYINQYIAENVSGFGTAADEKVRSRAEFRSMVMRGRQQSKGFLFKAKIITPYRPKFTDENTAQFHDEMIVQIGDKKNKHTLHLWFSTIYKYQKNKWQLVMFHGSMPDAGSSTSDTFHVAEAEKKVKKLEDIVEQRTIELQTKNNELEIETALERVRAIALSMQRSEDMLKVCQVISDELTRFGIQAIRNIQTVIIREEKKFYLCYQYFTAYKKSAVEVTYYQKNPVEKELVTKMLDAKGGYFEGSMKGKKLQQFREHRKKEKFLPDPRLDKSKEIFYYMYSIGEGALGITLFKDVKENELSLFKRFHQVFTLAYKRFRDIEQAEAQARESQIQLALEKVRAKSLAMHHTSELQVVIHTVHKELLNLNIAIDGGSFIAINGDIDTKLRCWGSGGTADTSEEVILPLYKKPFCSNLINGIKKGPAFFTEEFSQQEKKEFFKFLFNHAPWSKLSAKQKKETLLSPGGYTRSCCVSHHTSIFIINHFGRKFTSDENDILKRFAKVFEQTYTRFLDLQKAEAQTREAEIELALERVRARTMAMQKSDELREVIQTVTGQLQSLGFIFDDANFTTQFDQKGFYLWNAAPGSPVLAEVFVPYTNLKFINWLFENRKKKAAFESHGFDKKDKDSFFKYYFTDTDGRRVPEEVKKRILDGKAMAVSTAFRKEFALSIFNYQGTVFTEDENNIISRFANVFEQSYTRFLDLQKAEAQARENQIQLALERVRARTMAMHSSDDVGAATATMFLELEKLGIKNLRGGIAIISPDQTQEIWSVNNLSDGTVLRAIGVFDMRLHPFWQQIFKTHKNKKDFDYYWLAGKDKEDYIAIINATPGYLPQPIREFPNVHIQSYYFGEGAIWTNSLQAHTEEHKGVMKKFATVFSLTFRRYQDLQKAEAQTRESQIQLALERVRARTMAMQNPQEFVDVIHVIGEQFVHLGFDIEWVNFGANRLDIAAGIDTWNFAVIPGAEPVSSRLFIPRFNHTLFRDANTQIDNYRSTGSDFFVMTYNKKVKDKWLDHLFSKTIFKDLPDEYRTVQYTKPGYTTSNLILKDTFLSIGKFDTTGFTDDQNAILKRFGNAFGIAFTRFNELQKAEAQARESQIQLAVERVRAKALAMHKSEEILGVVKTLRNELGSLNIPGVVAVTIYLRQVNGDVMLWDITSMKEFGEEIHFTMNFNFRMEEADPGLWIRKIWDADENYIIVEQNEHDLKRAIKWTRRYNTETAEMTQQFITANKIVHSWHPAVKLSNGKLTADFIQPPPTEVEFIMSKIGAAFDLAYTRFLDLQKAEAQAREAKIEAALEKVRSRSLAMHKSDEIKEVVKTVVEKMTELNIEKNSGIALVTFLPESKDSLHWLWIPEKTKEVLNAYLPYFDHLIHYESNAEREQGVELITKVYSGKDKQSYFKHLFYQTDFSAWPEEVKEFVLQQPYFGFSFAIQKHSGIFLNDYTGKYFSKETNDILVRFSKVFEQSYVRFLDLQKAEAQAREAQIELALERVRAKTMAMQKSNELNDAAIVLFEQVKSLGFDTGSCGFNIWEKNEKAAMVCVSSPEGGLQLPFKMPHTESELYKQAYSAMEKGDDFFIKEVSGDELTKHFDYLLTLAGIGAIIKKLRDANYAFPESIIYHFAFFKQGYLSFHEHKHEPAAIGIFKRFAKVFEQTYTRFLDLQKAEAQTREAQIEAALERIRAKAMAMHHSDELDEVLVVLWEQFYVLGIRPMSTHMTLIDIESNTFTFRETGKGGHRSFGEQVVAIDSMDIWKNEAEKWRTSEPLSINRLHFPKESLPMLWQVFNESFASMPDDAKIVPEDYPDGIYHTAGNCKFGYIGMNQTRKATVEEEQIVLKFATEFGRFYQRFLDLKKAEAQAREAQIETALERVRSRSLAMHQSSELEEVIMVVSEQLQQLQFRFHNVSFVRYDEKKGLNFWLASPGRQLPFLIKAPYLDNPVYNRPLEALKNGVDFMADVLTPEENHEWLKHLIEHANQKNFSDDDKKNLLNTAGFARSFILMKQIILVIGNYAAIPYTDEQNFILKRFANVFDQAYTRFLDLQKAEAQAREAQIEASLERVRSASMAMHSSDELQNVIRVLTDQLTILGFEFHSANFITNASMPDWEMWISSPGSNIPPKIFVPYFNHRLVNERNDAVTSGKDMLTMVLNQEEKTIFFKYFFELTGAKGTDEDRIKWVLDQPGMALTTVVMKSFSLSVINYYGKLYTESENEVIKRLAHVFEQSYTRFLDLQKAEAQAREAQIEAALERVRSRTMAMFKSDELAETAVVVFKQMINLGIEPNRLYIAIINDNSGDLEFWITDENGDKVSSRYLVNINKNISIKKMYDGWAAKKKTITIDMQGGELEDWLTYWREEFHVPFKPGAALKRRVQSIAYFSKGFIAIASPDDQPEPTINLLEKFAAVFNLTYTRFNDLQQAEAQAREAQVEAALERVRSKTMAMHNSEDVAETVATMFDELKKLQVETYRCGIGIMHETEPMELWTARPGVQEKADLIVGRLDMNIHPLFQGALNGWKSKDDSFSYELKEDDLLQYYTTLNKQPDYPVKYDLNTLPPQLFHNDFYFNEGTLFIFSLKKLSAEASVILKRFASVFGQTYRRYLDLQQAEAQAREAQIETGLERVRSRTLAMHKSDELAETAAVMFKQLIDLGIAPNRLYISIIKDENSDTEFWITDEDGFKVSMAYTANLNDNLSFKKMLDGWKEEKQSLIIDMHGDELQKYFKHLTQLNIPFKGGLEQKRRIQHIAYFGKGFIGMASPDEQPKETMQLLERFAAVFNLTYTRFNDLQQAEAQAREALIEASLERMRSVAMSIRKSEELIQVAESLYNELRGLGITNIRNAQIVIKVAGDETYLVCVFSDESSEVIREFRNNTSPITQKMYEELETSSEALYQRELTGKEFEQWLKWREDTGAKIETKLLQARSVTFCLYSIGEGHLGISAYNNITKEQLSVLKRFRNVFELSYRRFMDVAKSEEQSLKLQQEKDRLENALNDLQATQKQLIQSEKMASLGELTAGIAHEIQNPLNFVNNFSEVSTELVDEMKVELSKSNYEDANAIADDLKQNLEKINHHGKRAGDIVKGMLQHSRTSTGQKELADINALCDEYLRLAYHGLRAKDKSFNAKFETDFDDTVGKVSVMSQDIGRVILNLINNAFYAASLPSKGGFSNPDYVHSPTVWVNTKKEGNKIFISVRDNGPGIPQNILDKIFQPFFTTKPTGQGTGLGLSLSYDIVKAHGGELKVETEEARPDDPVGRGKGSEFIISLPFV